MTESNVLWQTFYDENYKREYFYNPETDQTLWILPKGAEALPLGMTAK